MKYIIIYLAVINIVGFAAMGIDKHKAKKHSWRISEKTLFIIALVGGSIGAFAGMRLFRHKTNHKQFIFGIPAIILLQLASAIYVLYKFY